MFGFPWWLRQERMGLKCRRPGFDPWVGKISWRREWLPTPVFLPGEVHGQGKAWRATVHKESDTTERLTHTYTACDMFILCLKIAWLKMYA